MFKKIILSWIFCFLCLNTIISETYSKQQLIPVDSWIYDALYTLSAEQKKVVNADIGPCSVKELQLYFSTLDYEQLSEPGKELYDQVQQFFNEKKLTLDLSAVKIGFNVNLYPELLYKSNSEIDWTFGSKNSVTYTINSYKADGSPDGSNDKTFYYCDVSSWAGNQLSKPLLSFPVNINFADYAYIELIPFISNRFLDMARPNNFTNIPLSFSSIDFMQPTTAYFSTGHIFKNNVGIDLQIGKEGLQIGRSLLGSVIYNNTFQTDAYFKFDAYSPKFRYDMNVVEIDHTKFLYLHDFQAIPFPWLKIGFLEGVLINDSFEIRYLNPLMIMHSFHSWTEYRTEQEYDIYGECHESAYFGLSFDIVPYKNLRLYGLYSQVEIQLPSELEGEYGRHLPTSFAGQLGVEYKMPILNGWGSVQLEGLYSSPYMYYKTGADWSLYRARFDNYSSTSNPLCSWMGSPFGPDSAGFILKAGYNKDQKWSADLSYMYMAQGENSFNLFFKTVNIDGKTFWTYYPSTQINGSYVEDSSVARSMALSGIIQHNNRLTLNGHYTLNKHFSFDGQFIYEFIFNNNHTSGNFQQGVQLSFATEYKIF